MSIYSFSDIELQAYKNIWIAIQNYDVHAELPAIDSEKALTLYKKVLSESKSGYMYNQNQIRMCNGYWGSRIEFGMCDEFKNGRITIDILDMKPVVFDNAELGTILTQMADFYHVKVRYDNADTQHVRLFFNWNKTKTLEQNLEILNAFDRIQIEYAEGELVVK